VTLPSSSISESGDVSQANASMQGSYRTYVSSGNSGSLSPFREGIMDHQALAQLLGNYGEFVGAIAVVATLVYLALQIRENSRSTRALIEQSTAEFVSKVNLDAATDTDLAALVGRGLSDLAELEDHEIPRFMMWVLSSLRSYEIAHHQFAEGHLSEPIWHGMQGSIANLLQNESARKVWMVRKVTFSPNFQKFVDSLGIPEGLIPASRIAAALRGASADG